MLGRPRLFHRLSINGKSRFRQASKSYERASIEEDKVWRNLIAPCLDGFAEGPAMRVLEFGSTEMISNARDHSEGTKVGVAVEVDMAFATIRISDDGEGIFTRIKRTNAAVGQMVVRAMAGRAGPDTDG